jgi:hypothetical protein
MKLIYKIDSNVLKAEVKLVTGGIELQILKVRKILNLQWRVIDTVQIIGDNLLELRSRYIYDQNLFQNLIQTGGNFAALHADGI